MLTLSESEASVNIMNNEIWQWILSTRNYPSSSTFLSGYCVLSRYPREIRIGCIWKHDSPTCRWVQSL